MANITIIEPHALLRLGLIQLLAELGPDIYVHSRDYPMPDEPHASWQTDVALWSLPRSGDIDAHLATIERTYGPTRIIAMGEDTPMPASLIPQAHRMAGYLPKSCPPEMLKAAVNLVMAGGSCFPQIQASQASQTSMAPDTTLSTSVLQTPEQAMSPAPTTVNHDPVMKPRTPPLWPPASPPGPMRAPLHKKEVTEHELLGLTPRQYEVLVLLARGYPMKTVGRCLNISVATAKAHTETLYQRLDVHNRNAAVYAAVSRGAKLGWACIGAEADPEQGCHPH